MEELQHRRESDPDGGSEASALDETIAFWEPIAGRKLNREDARQIRENLTGCFRVLMEWDTATNARERGERAA